jgi:hypothetical protein
LEDERANKKLTFALNGSAAATQRMLSWKDRMMGSTLFTEDEIRGAITMGTELGRTEAQTKKMAETAMGLANVTGMDLNSAMMMLAATFEGQTKGVKRFASEVGDLTKEQLANGEAIDILSKKFTKFADEGLNTAAGQLKNFKKLMTESSEDAAGSFISFLTKDLIKFKLALEVVKRLTDKNAVSPQIQDLYDQIQDTKDNTAAKIEQAKADENRNFYLEKLAKATKPAKDATEDLTKQFNKQKKEVQELGKLYSFFVNELRRGSENKNTDKGKFKANLFDLGLSAPASMSPVANSPNQPGSVDGGTKPSEAMQAIRESIELTSASLAGLGSNFQNLFSSLGDTFIKFKEGFKGGWKEMASSIGAVMQSAVAFISDLFTQQNANKIAALDETYNYERDRIEGSKMNEGAKKKALEKLDRDTQKQKKALMRENAKDQKEASIMQAVIAGALGVIQAMSAPFPLDIIMPVLIGAMAAVQIANIISTPLPALAKGGLAYGPTVAQIGEYPGASNNPEVIAPLDKLRGMLGGGGDGGVLEARVRGEDLLFVLNRAKTAQNRRYGS